MKLCHIAACALASTVISASAADVSLFRTVNEQASVSGCSTSGACVVVSIQTSDDVINGVLQGNVSVLISDPNSPPFFQIVSCFGPAFASLLVLNHGNGDATIRGTLDPTAPGCRGVNVVAPLTIDLTGRADGNVHISVDGFFTNDFGGQITRGKTREDRFSDAFEGIVGTYSGPFETGNVAATRNFQHEQVTTPR
jgi:hypothetical protein